MPRLISDRRLTAAGRRRSEPAYEPAWRKLRVDTEAFLQGPRLHPPDEPAGFYHDYFCPDCAQQLCFDPAKPHTHRCPLHDRLFAGELYDAAWRWFANNLLSTMAYQLALVWSLEGDEDCRRRTQQILLDYADRYPSYSSAPPRHRGVGRGKATYQSLDEAVWLIPVARAYDLMGESLNPDDRRVIEDALLRPAAEHLLQQRFLQVHNIECWHNAAITAVGSCLGVVDWQATALDGEFGLLRQLSEGVDEDGLWWEGSSSYHFYALTALVTHVQLLEDVDETLIERAPRLGEMFAAAVRLVQPDFSLPATNDCWFSASLLGDVCHGVPAAAALYEVAYGWYDDPLFAWVLQQNYARHRRDSVEALLYGGDLPAVEVDLPAGGVSFPAAGMTLLRSADPLPSQTCVLLKHGPHGGGHGHPDKLGISFYAGGHRTSPDLGTPGYGISLNDTWFRQTASHNTVVIDGQSQPPGQGRLVTYESGDAGGGFSVADARMRWHEEPYLGVAMRRTILLCGDFFVDLFLVECEDERLIDWLCRFRGDLIDSAGLGDEEPVCLNGDGYEHVMQPSRCRAETAVRLDWRLSSDHLSAFFPTESGTEVIRGRVPFNPASTVSDMLIRRRRTATTAFVALLHPWRDEPAITRVEAYGDELPDDTWALWVERAAERQLVVLALVDGAPAGETRADRVLSYTLKREGGS